MLSGHIVFKIMKTSSFQPWISYLVTTPLLTAWTTNLSTILSVLKTEVPNNIKHTGIGICLQLGLTWIFPFSWYVNKRTDFPQPEYPRLQTIPMRYPLAPVRFFKIHHLPYGLQPALQQFWAIWKSPPKVQSEDCAVVSAIIFTRWLRLTNTRAEATRRVNEGLNGI